MQHVRFERGAPSRQTLVALARSTSEAGLLRDEQRAKPKTGGLLPPLGVKHAHPQSYRDTLAYSRPALWPWTDINPEDLEDEEEDYSPQKSLAPSSSAPQLGYSTSEMEHRRRSVRGGGPFEPESLLSPFALQARRFGADVLITGQRLRPSTGSLFSWTIIDAEDDRPDSDRTPQKEPHSPAQALATSSTAGSPVPAAKRQPAARQPFRVPGVVNSPWSSGARPATVPHRRGRRKGGRQQQALGGAARPADQGPAGLLDASVVASRAEQESALRLPAGPAGMWDNISSLSAVRELHDRYAADPLAVAPPALGDDGDGASVDFLRSYVERQAEIERLLHERGQRVART